MAILTIGKILKEAGLDTSKRIKLVRHKDNRSELMIDGKVVNGNPYDWYINDRKSFIAYQSEQSEERFKNADYIVSFIGEDGTTARMVGVYRVLGLDKERMERVNNGHFFYQMEEVDGFDELNERVIIDWGKSAINWHQWLDKNDKEIIAIERKGIRIMTRSSFLLSSYSAFLEMKSVSGRISYLRVTVFMSFLTLNLENCTLDPPTIARGSGAAGRNMPRLDTAAM